MSNVYTGNPWILDTTGAITTKSVKVHIIRWVGGANTNAATLTDAAGAVWWNAVAPADNFKTETVFQTAPHKAPGLTVTITGGTLYVYIEGPIPFTV